MTIAVGIFLLFVLAGFSISPVLASTGSIATVNYYPQDQAKYDSVNCFLWQTTAVNTNTTVSVSIDGAPPIPLTYQGIQSEAITNDTVQCDWYTWQTMVPAITAPGNHTFQFFSHYYVWQDVDKYWAEFNASSDIHSITINSCLPNLSPSPNPTSTKSAATLNAAAAPSEVAMLGIIASGAVAFVFAAALQSYYLRKKSKDMPFSRHQKN